MKKAEIEKAIIEMDDESSFIMENLDDRLLALEKRMNAWEKQTTQHVATLADSLEAIQDFSIKLAVLLEEMQRWKKAQKRKH